MFEVFERFAVWKHSLNMEKNRTYREVPYRKYKKDPIESIEREQIESSERDLIEITKIPDRKYRKENR